MQQLVVLSVKMKFFGSEDVVHPVVLMDSQYRVLVDCGPVGALERIEEALRAHQIEPSSITHIIMTHQDHDHVGCAAAFKRRYPSVKVVVFGIEKSFTDRNHLHDIAIRSTHHFVQHQFMACPILQSSMFFLLLVFYLEEVADDPLNLVGYRKQDPYRCEFWFGLISSTVIYPLTRILFATTSPTRI